MGIKSADLEEKFFLLDFCGFPNCLDVEKGRKEWLGRFKCVATGLDASLSFLLRREGVLANGLPVSPLYNFLQ